jgi:hypothetical protein
MTEENLPDKPLIIGRTSLDAEGNIGGIAGGWNAIKIAQKVFQQKHCPNCGHYSQEKKDFREKNHPNNPEDCLYHWTDILG